MRTYICLIVFILSALQAFSQATPDQTRIFSESLTSALKKKDKEAFYALVCFDDVDQTWRTMGEASFDSLLQQFEPQESFAVTVGPADPAALKPIKYKDELLSFNLPVEYQAQISFPDSERLKNRKTTFLLGVKDGKLLIALRCPQTAK